MLEGLELWQASFRFAVILDDYSVGKCGADELGGLLVQGHAMLPWHRRTCEDATISSKLETLMGPKDFNHKAQLQECLYEPMGFDFIKYKKGRKNVIADALSRSENSISEQRAASS
uniref:Uncharacterized protein n=1 Tax=Nelumbo nucifera TaxID=4432 RepID=A0A822Y8R9_NELNU|nr:TPA_asm: hypothetical protein HUJ06_029064 [Nelumbo nucifera]